MQWCFVLGVVELMQWCLVLGVVELMQKLAHVNSKDKKQIETEEESEKR